MASAANLRRRPYGHPPQGPMVWRPRPRCAGARPDPYATAESALMRGAGTDIPTRSNNPLAQRTRWPTLCDFSLAGNLLAMASGSLTSRGGAGTNGAALARLFQLSSRPKVHMPALNVPIQIMARTLLGAIAIAVTIQSAGGQGTPEDGLAAYREGDYVKAVRLWRPLAEKGDPVAQYRLGAMYT